MANYDYGHDTVNGVGGHWQGIAGYARFQANKVVAIAPRFEWYNDDAGFTTGAVQTLRKPRSRSRPRRNDSLMWRIEYRGDFSDQRRVQEPRRQLQGHSALDRREHAVFLQRKGKIAADGDAV